jgi:hypothetical protein
MQRLIHQGARLCMAHTALLLCVLFLQFCTVRTLHAQANAGITGTVTDSTGAVIAGAQITITNQSTGVQNHAVTSSSGTYTVTGLIPGAYSVEVNAGGV